MYALFLPLSLSFIKSNEHSFIPMTDASPENYYLLFNRCDEFETQDKVSYALSDDRESIWHPHIAASLEENVRRKILLRSLDVLKCGKFGDVGVNSPTSGASRFSDRSDSYSSCDGIRHNAMAESIDGTPWESSTAKTNEWNWPLEILYQNYHVHVVVDYLRLVAVSPSGCVFYDRIPEVLDSILAAVQAALEQRRKDYASIQAWLKTSGVDEELQTQIMQQVWNPEVLISVSLINVPQVVDPAGHDSSSRSFRCLKRAAQREWISPEVKMFSSQAREGGTANLVPLLVCASAKQVVDDKKFIHKLEETLSAHEMKSRAPFACCNPMSLEATIEFLLRSAPNTSKYCESIVFATNTEGCGCSNEIGLLEGIARRKNIIFSLVTLNHSQDLESPSLISLTHFVHRIGGFIVDIDHWRVLASPNLNRAWSARFEGSRCLSQQLFVQFIGRFPHKSHIPSQRPFALESVILFESSRNLNSLPQETVSTVLKAIAVARFNENWSVLMHHPSDGSVHLLARDSVHLLQGSLVLEYELHIVPPILYRSVYVIGSKALTHHFNQIAVNDASSTDEKASQLPAWKSPITAARRRLHEQIHAEEVMLQLLLNKTYPEELSKFSNRHGVFYMWLHLSTVRSITILYDLSGGKDIFQLPMKGELSHPSIVVSSIKAMMKEGGYTGIDKDNELLFIRQAEGVYPYVVQLLPIGCGNTFREFSAGCFECRISFFCGWRQRTEEVRHLLTLFNNQSDDLPRDRKVTFQAYTYKQSQSTLGIVLPLTSGCHELPTTPLSNPIEWRSASSGANLKFCIPYPAPTFPLKKAFTFHWSFSWTAEINIRRKLFGFVLLRRQETFDCLLCNRDSQQAVLQRKKTLDSVGTEIDYVEVTGNGSCLSFTRVITKMTLHSIALLQADVKHDEKIFTALHTFFHKVSSKRLLSRKNPASQLSIESLLYYVTEDCSEIVKYHSPLSLGENGTKDLRNCFHQYLDSLSGSQVVNLTSFTPAYASYLRKCGPSSATSAVTKVHVGSIVPTSANASQGGSIAFFFIVDNNDAVQSDSQFTVEVVLSFISNDRLHQELLSCYQRQGTVHVHNRKDTRSDERLLQLLKSPLAARASIHSTSRLLCFLNEKRQASPDDFTSLDDTMVSDIMTSTMHLSTYVQDVDITPLLHVAQGIANHSQQSTREEVRHALSTILGSVSCSYDPLPSLWFPNSNAVGESYRDMATPVLMKCAAVLEGGEQEENEKVFWVSSLKRSDTIGESSTGFPSTWSGDEGFLQQNQTLRLRLFLVSSMTEDKYTKRTTVSRILGEKPPERDLLMSNDFISLEKLSSTVVLKLSILVSCVKRAAIRYCMAATFCSSGYLSIHQIVCEPEEALLAEGPEATRVNNPKYDSLRQTSVSKCARIASAVGVQTILKAVVMPLIFDDVMSQIMETPLQVADNDDSVQDVCDLFQHYMAEDRIAVIATQEGHHIFIPNVDTKCSTWIAMAVEFREGFGFLKVAHYVSEGANSAVASDVVQRLSDYVRAKMMEICQLRLMRNLCYDQRMKGKLLPERWGDQFGFRGQEASHSTTKPAHATSPLASLERKGRTILEIPLYYKLQNQCSRILNFICRQAQRLELITVYDQRQCFVVADDSAVDVFHCLRLVFLRNTESAAPTSEPSPSLLITDRCHQLVVQLFSPVDNAAVRIPLKKIQSCCYFLAVQELKGQLNYYSVLSVSDALFLQNQKMDPLYIRWSQVCPSSERGAEREMIALSLVVLHLNENHFKYFDVSEEQYSSKNAFVQHYSLDSRIGDLKSASEKSRVWRFVKLVEEVTDVLVSCTLHWDSEAQRVVLQPYFSAPPMDCFTTGEFEKSTLSELDSCRANMAEQLDFFFLSRQTDSGIRISELNEVVKKLLAVRCSGKPSESVVLCSQRYSLESVSLPTVPYLVERLCGAVASFGPCCFQYGGFDLRNTGGENVDCHAEFLPSFPWKWIEAVQNDPLLDCMKFDILCGFNIMTENNTAFTPSRVVPHTVPRVTVGSSTFAEAKEGELKSLGLQCKINVRIVIRVDLMAEELSVTIFNLRDVEALLIVINSILHDCELKSELLQDVLLQHTGFMPYDSVFTESTLTSCCCGDGSNVIQNRKLRLDMQNYRRPHRMMRFPSEYKPSPSGSKGSSVSQLENSFNLMVSGLYNRGLVVNEVFTASDAIKVLFDDAIAINPSLSNCEQLMRKFEKSFMVPDDRSSIRPQVMLARDAVTNTRGKRDHYSLRRNKSRWQSSILIACSYRRHIFMSHIIVEAQNAQASLQQKLSLCEELYYNENVKSQDELTSVIIYLQSKSQQIYGTRVPDFPLSREKDNPADKILNQDLPVKSDISATHAVSVDIILKSYATHLSSLYHDHGARLIELDLNNSSAMASPLCVSRLRCRYGKVCTAEGDIVQFCPRLHYVVIPVYYLLQASFSEDAKLYSSAPICSCGLIIVEIGFQVTHYALDIFLVNGSAIPAHTTAKLIADFTQKLSFESVLYDHQVRRVMNQLRRRIAPLPGHQSVPEVMELLTSFYPTPPISARTVAYAYYIRNFFREGKSAGGDQPSEGMDTTIFLAPSKDEIYSSQSKKPYRFCGLAVWKTLADNRPEKTQCLHVLLEPAIDTVAFPSLHSEDVHSLFSTAKKRLIKLLHRTTHQQRLVMAWMKFVSKPSVAPCPFVEMLGSVAPSSMLTMEEYHLVLKNSIRIYLPKATERIKEMMDAVDWPAYPLYFFHLAAMNLYPTLVIHAISQLHEGATKRMRKAPPRRKNGSPRLRSPVFTEPAPPSAIVDILSCRVPQCIVFTLSNQNAAESFLVVEGWFTVTGGFSLVEVEEVSLIRKDGMPSDVAASQVRDVNVGLSEEEHSLVAAFRTILAHAMWEASLHA